MKRAWFVLLTGIVVVSGCDSGGDNRTAVQKSTPNVSVPEKKTPSLMTGERDTFHPKSVMESSRKLALTDFGKRPDPLPVVTPDVPAVEKAVEHPEFVTMNVVFFINKEPAVPGYPFDYENDIGALKRLYQSHDLDTVLRGAVSELERLEALTLYTYSFLSGGTEPGPEDDIGPSAEVITKLKLEKNVGGTSKHYAAVLCQLALSCGFNARMVGMHTVDNTGSIMTHDVCEVFMNSFDKWVVFDAFNRATYYERNSVPQSALELRDIMLDRNYRVLTPHSGSGDYMDVVSVREKVLPLYRYLYIWRMNDILGRSPRGGTIPWEALYLAHLVWEDEQAPVAEGGFDRLERFNSHRHSDYPLDGVRFVTHDRNDFYWPLNHVSINVERTGQKDIILYFDTITPNFKTFEIMDNVVSLSHSYRHDMNNPTNFVIRAVNVFGVKGPESRLGFSF